MGAWGTGLFSDDLACDVRVGFRDAIGDGLTPAQATQQVLRTFAESPNDPDERGIFWCALAKTAWDIGRLENEVRLRALQEIGSAKDLDRWIDPTLKRQRQEVLFGVAARLQSPQRPPPKIARRIVSTNDWKLGELVGFKLRSGRWTLLHVVGEHTDQGGTIPCCELIDWVGDEAPNARTVAARGVVAPKLPHLSRVFMFQPPRKPADMARVARWGLFRRKSILSISDWFRGPKTDTRQSRTVMVWPFVDQLLLECFGVE